MEEHVSLHKVQKKGRRRVVHLVFVYEGEEIVALRSKPDGSLTEYSPSQVRSLLGNGWLPEGDGVAQYLRGCPAAC